MFPKLSAVADDKINTKTQQKSAIRILAKTNTLSIEILELLGTEDSAQIIALSETLEMQYGAHAKWNENTVQRYFNFPTTQPIVARLFGKIVGFIVGVPLENFAKEFWAKGDSNLHQHNTSYTYAFVVGQEYRGKGYAATLKTVYLNQMKKLGYDYVSGHVLDGVAREFSKTAVVIRKYKNWQSTGKTFEYYRRPLN